MIIKKLLNRLMKPEDGEGGNLPGGDDNDTGEAVGTLNDKRLAFYNSINDKLDDERAVDLMSVNDDGTTEAFALPSDDNGVTAAELARAAEEANLIPDPVDPAPPAVPQLITRKVNGRDISLPLEEWIARGQKVEAADMYLSEANRLRKEAEAAALQARPQNTQASSRPAVLATDESRRALVRALQMGTEDEALAALTPLFAAQAPQTSQEDVVRVLDERLSFKDAVSTFARDYADIVGDPFFRQVAQQRDDELRAAGDTRSYAERYTSIGNELRAVKTRLTGTPPVVNTTQQVADPVQAKVAAKADAARRAPPRSTSSKATANANAEESDENVSDVIANIARARGGPQWARA